MATSQATLRGTSYRMLLRWRKALREAGRTIQAAQYQDEIGRRRVKALLRAGSLVFAACTGAFAVLWTSTGSALHDHWWAAAAGVLTVLTVLADART